MFLLFYSSVLIFVDKYLIEVAEFSVSFLNIYLYCSYLMKKLEKDFLNVCSVWNVTERTVGIQLIFFLLKKIQFRILRSKSFKSWH
jgi:hypothetical protein